MSKKKIERDEAIDLKNPDAKQVVPALKALKMSPGWKIITEVLLSNIQKIEHSILDSDDRMDAQELTKYRDMRFFEKQLIEFPDKIIAAYEQEDSDIQPMELDPYAQEPDLTSN